MTRRITVLGTGLMGSPIATVLARSGYEVTVYNRTAGKARAIEPAGVTVAASAQAAVDASPLLLTMLADAKAVETMVLSVSDRRLAGSTLIQMSTIGPAESAALDVALRQKGCRYLEAPVLGSIPEAEAGDLIVMAGGPEEVFDECRPVLDSVGAYVLRVGPVGAAAALKLAINQLIGSLTSAFALSLGLVRRSGVDHEVFMDVVRRSALYAKTFDKKLDRMLDREYGNPNFPTKHLLKDMVLFDRAARTVNVDAASLSGTIELLIEVVNTDELADGDYSAIYEAIDHP